MVSVASFSAEARAEDPRIARAQAIFGEGLRAATDHREAEALQKFKDAYAVYPGPNILAAIGREKQVLGQDLEAVRDLRAALRDPLLNPENTSRVKAQIAEAESRLGRLLVNGPEGAKVIVDEREQTLPLREPVDVARGPFRVKASLAGKSKEVTGDAKAGVITTVALAFEDAAAEVTSPPHEADPRSWNTGKTVGVVLWAGAAISAGVGVGFTLGANSAADKVSAARAGSASPDTACFGVTSVECQGRKDAESSRATDTNVAVGSFIGAGALLVVGTVAFFWPASRNSSTGGGRPSLAPVIGKQWQGLVLEQEF
ncbi:hypothetical protein BH11MYX4_BH11MYX4_36560 [soil metagenome]